MTIAKHEKDYEKIKEEDFDQMLEDFGRVNDPDLEQSISGIIDHLIGPGSKLKIVLCENIIPLGIASVGVGHSVLIISTKAADLLQSEEGRQIVYATLAHEIGHIVFTKKTDYHYEDTMEYKIKHEIEADRIALGLLKIIYDNPKDILLKQINRAFNKMTDIENVDPVKMDLAIAFKEEREKALQHLMME